MKKVWFWSMLSGLNLGIVRTMLGDAVAFHVATGALGLLIGWHILTKQDRDR